MKEENIILLIGMIFLQLGLSTLTGKGLSSGLIALAVYTFVAVLRNS